MLHNICEEANGKKSLEIKFELNIYLLTLLYLCFTYNISLDMLLALYEQYGKQSLFVFKALACKKNISISDKQFTGFMDESKRLYRQILKHNIILYDYTHSYQLFIKWLNTAIEDIYAEQVKLKVDYTDLYDALGKYHNIK